MLYDKRWTRTEVAYLPTWRDILMRAADLIEEHGLAKHTTLDSEGRMCARGAIMLAFNPNCPVYGTSGRPSWPKWGCGVGVLREADAQLASYLGLLPDWENVASWNNHVSRTQEEVVAALRGAAGG